MHKLALLTLSLALLLPAVAIGDDPAAPDAVEKTVIRKLKKGAQAVTVDSQGRLLAIGGGGNYGNTRPVRLARLLPDARRDPSFGQRGVSSVSLAERFESEWYVHDPLPVDGSDSAYALVSAFGGSEGVGVLKFQPDGAIDRSWGTDGIARLQPGSYVDGGAMTIDSAGRLLVGLRVDQSDDGPINSTIIRLDPTGAVDPSFGSGGEVRLPEGERVADLELDSENRIVVSVDASWKQERPIMRLLPDGELDPGFGRDGEAEIPDPDVDRQELEIDGEDRIVVSYSTWDSERQFSIARLTASGDVDETFGDDGIATLSIGRQVRRSEPLAIDGEDRVVIGTSVRPVRGHGGKTDIEIARLTSDGSLDRSFGDDGSLLIDFKGGSERLSGLTVAPDGTIIAACAAQSAKGRGMSGAIALIWP